MTAGGSRKDVRERERETKQATPAGRVHGVVIGDRLKFLSVLFTLKQRPNEDTFRRRAGRRRRGREPRRSRLPSQRALDDASTWRRTLQAAIDDYNKEKADVVGTQARPEVRHPAARLLPGDGKLTPTLKLKRAAVSPKSATRAGALYTGDAFRAQCGSLTRPLVCAHERACAKAVQELRATQTRPHRSSRRAESRLRRSAVAIARRASWLFGRLWRRREIVARSLWRPTPFVVAFVTNASRAPSARPARGSAIASARRQALASLR